MPILLINNFSGISDGSKIGLAGSFRMGRGLDCNTDPDVLKISPASTKDSGNVVTGLVKFAAANTINSNIYFLDENGAVYKEAGGVYSKVTTYSTGQGMGFFNGTGKVIFCSGDREYKLDPSSDAISGGRTLNNADWHPVESFLDKVFIGDGREIISTDGSGIDYDSNTTGGGIKLEWGHKVSCLKNVGDWLFIGTKSDNSSLASYYIWDGTSAAYNYSKKLKGEDGISACEVADDGTVIIVAGKSGNIYQLTGLDTTLNKVKTIPLVESDKTIEIYPGAITNYKSNILFGLSGGTSLTAQRGVYSWASHSHLYPKALNLEYIPSSAAVTGTTVQIGTVHSPNTNDLYISWRNGATYGVDLVDGSGVQPSAIYQSLIFDASKPFIRKFFKQFKVTLAKELANGEKVELSYKADRAASWTSLETMDFSVDAGISEKSFKPSGNIKCRELEIQLEFTNTGATSAEIDSISILYDEEDLT